MIPDVVNITEAKVHGRYGLEQLIYPKDTIIVEDRAYFDFDLMLNRIKVENVFIIGLCMVIKPVEPYLPIYRINFFGEANDPDTAKYYERFFEIVKKQTRSVNKRL